ncbi:MAG: winged helix-turn-helix transcriptional regulator [Planctomycetota bacterium]
MKEPRSPCPVVFALDLLGDRWTLLVIRDLALRGMSTYGELLAAGEGIATNVLADRLKRLEAADVLTKSRDPQHGARNRYRLTSKGLDLIPILVEMMRWSAKHDPACPMSAALRLRLLEDPEGVAADARARAEQG